MKYFDYLTLYFDDGAESAQDNGAGTPAEDKGAKAAEKTEKTDRTTPKYSDDDLDKIIEKKMAKWQKQQAKAVDEAAKLATMTAQERAEHERDTYLAELNELKAEKARGEMERTARGMLRNDGVDVPDEIVQTLIREDAETTNTAVKAFSKAYKAAVQAEVKKQLSHGAPKTGAKSNVTVSDIMSIKDEKKRQAAIKEHMALFRK